MPSSIENYCRYCRILPLYSFAPCPYVSLYFFLYILIDEMVMSMCDLKIYLYTQNSFHEKCEKITMQYSENILNSSLVNLVCRGPLSGLTSSWPLNVSLNYSVTYYHTYSYIEFAGSTLEQFILPSWVIDSQTCMLSETCYKCTVKMRLELIICLQIISQL